MQTTKKKLVVPDGSRVVDFSELYTPHPQQIKAHTAKERYILFGGARGGGKSYYICAEPIQLCLDFPGNRGFLCRHENAVFRKTTFGTLCEIMPWDAVVKHDKQDQYIDFYNKSRLYYGGLRPTQSDKPLDRVKSWDLGFFAIDEATETEETFFLMLTGCLRHKKVPSAAYKGILASNPEPGWVKRRFIDKPMSNSRFIPSLPSDNPHLPPEYVDELRRTFAGSPGWVERYLEGDWNAAMSMREGFYVYPWPWVMAAYQRTLKRGKPIELGVDVARGGGDKTQIYVRYGDVAEHVGEGDFKDTMDVVAMVDNAIKQFHPSSVKIDAIGVGAGVADRLGEIYEDNQDIDIVPFIAGVRAGDNERFFNARAEIFWEVRERMEKGELKIPDDSTLHGQMSRIRFRTKSDKRIVIESKEDMRRKGEPSPDKLDALVLAFGGSNTGMDIYFV